MLPSTDTEQVVSPGREGATLWGLGGFSKFSEITQLVLPQIRPTAGAMVERREFKLETSMATANCLPEDFQQRIRIFFLFPREEVRPMRKCLCYVLYAPGYKKVLGQVA